MSKNLFTIADRRFTNLESATVQVVQFQFTPVKQFLDSVTSIYRTIDFDDDYQAEFGLNLWKLRCSVLFSLVPFDHEELELLEQVERISQIAERLPSSRESTAQMEDRLLALLELRSNPKLDWLAEQDWEGEYSAEIFAMMAMRKSFGSELIPQMLGNLTNLPEIISSVEQLGTGENSTLVIPGTCQYLSESLYMKLFHIGGYNRFHVLLYEGESFRQKDRLRLPESRLLPGFSEGKDLQIERSSVIKKADDLDGNVDERISDDLFSPRYSEISDGGRGILSRYVLCEDGKGFYVNESKPVRVWRTSGSDRLVLLYPAQLLEGDFVILEKSDRREMLDQTGNCNSFEEGLDATRAWRQPLQGLLLSLSPNDVANLMERTGLIPLQGSAIEGVRDTGISNSEAPSAMEAELKNLRRSILRWTEERSYGPGDVQHMRALVQVLVERGGLGLDCSPMDAADRWFRNLERLRAGRREAGRHVKNEIDDLIEDTIERGTLPTDGFELELDNGMVISLHKLSLIGNRVGKVSEWSLQKLI